MNKQTIQEDKIIRYYQGNSAHNKGSLRSAYGDAAALCDAIASDIESQYIKRGKLLKEGKALATIASRCAEAIWNMRDKISKSNNEKS